MRSDGEVADVIIIGGGFSGTMLAAQLARRGITSAIVEGGKRAGHGTAFSTPEAVHLLNVPAGRMSAWPDQPDDFAKHVSAHGYGPGDFVPRREFGSYLRRKLDDAVASGAVTTLPYRAVGARPSEAQWIVQLEGNSAVTAKAAVLAQGNQSPARPPYAEGLEATLFVNDPWSDDGRATITRAAASEDEILLIGTGLTMVDVVLSLQEAGHEGRILALSRRGLIPRAHEAFEPRTVAKEDVPHGSLAALWRWLRGHTQQVGWRAAVDSLRPHSQQLWATLTEQDQQRFLRHARPWWDVHRHRIAPEVADVLGRMIATSRLEVAAGRIVALRQSGPFLEADFQLRGTSKVSKRSFALAVNCTGPLGEIGKSKDGVLNDLFAAGLAQPDRLGIGLKVQDGARVAGCERLWALGALTKGKWWEIVAVPDIRNQVDAVADDIAKELDR